MKTCEYAGDARPLLRSHPWTHAESNPEFRYYDMRRSPALIRTALEDFVPFAGYPAIDHFYALLEWLNGPTSPLESNDCALIAPHPTPHPELGQALECSGRVMLLFRDLVRNVAPRDLVALTRALHVALAPADPTFELGVVGTTLVPVRYLTLPATPGAQLGAQLMVSFWAWGTGEADVMDNLDRVMRNLAAAVRSVVREVPASAR